MKSLSALIPRGSVLDGTADFVVNLADLATLTEDEAREFLDSNVLTSGMEMLLSQAFARLAGIGSASGIYKLSESMGGGKTQSMIVAGILARFPHLAKRMEFHAHLPDAKPDVVASFTGRSTDKRVWVAVGKALGTSFDADRAPSETEWRDALKGRSALILLDELAFYLVHAASQGSKEDGTRAATLAAIALTNLFGAVRDYKECRRCVIVIADLQKDWEQGAEELARIMRANDVLGGTMQSVSNEMAKGAQTIAPVDNSKDELYAILRRRLFKAIDVSSKDVDAIADAYATELKKASAIIERPTMKVREEILASYPFHFSTKHLIASFNDNPGFQKTRDVIRLMASIVRSLWAKGSAEVGRHHLLSLDVADLNDANVASRFIEIKKSLQDAMQTDIANSGTSHAETLDEETDDLATSCAKWIFSASLSEVHPRGLTDAELAEYLLAPGRSILGLHDALKKLYDTCWYIEQTKSGRYLFNRHKNLNAQVNSYTNVCTNADRDSKIEDKLGEMFEPKGKGCYQRLEVLPALDQVQLERDKATLVILKPDTDFQKFFLGQKYKNRVAFLTAVDQTGIFNVNKKAQRLWAISQVVRDLTPDDSQYKKAKETEAVYQTELFLALKAVFSKFAYPLVDDEGETALIGTTLLDGYIDQKTGHHVKYRNEEASKGEFVVEATLREANKFQVFSPGASDDKLKVYQPLRTRIEAFLFPPTGRATWDQIRDGAASRGHMLWTEPGTLDRMREALVTAGAWREEAGQLQKPPFDEITGVVIEYARDKESGAITTTDIKLAHADKLFVREDAGDWKAHPTDQPLVSEAMLVEFKAVDSTGKNQEGKPYRIENSIDLAHDFVPSPNPGHQFVKIKVVPPSSKLLYSLDGSNPANNGKPYSKPGIEVLEGVTVRLHVEKGGVVRDLSITVPLPHAGGSGTGASVGIKPDLPVTVSGKAFAHLVTRSAAYQFLTSLPAHARLQMVQAKVTVAATDNTVTLTWDRKTRRTAEQALAAFEFLDKQLTGAEWSLKFEQLHFASGKELLQWQVDTSCKIDPVQVTQ
ncbi:DUF499 domain-containing protein [Caballeronia sp. LZ008]|uniref:DUF499 domain-containing protein n=1 Tax=unclassified Caballeronia TaxID=2646786 RepID=UPI002028B93E|nr:MULTISPECIES: DUF499 domain-containing protein [unclassified Caballeronia]MDR5794497.1 DUF499 domain-containing protein [Caballeronia sp. LZ008]